MVTPISIHTNASIRIVVQSYAAFTTVCINITHKCGGQSQSHVYVMNT